MKTKLASYMNGNYHVLLLSDGTKIRATNDKEFKAEFPENIDLKVSNRCSVGCSFCHENSRPNGKIADFKKYESFIHSLHSGTELAVGGGALSELYYSDDPGEWCSFINRLISKGVIVNFTLNQNELDRLIIKKLNGDGAPLLEIGILCPVLDVSIQSHLIKGAITTFIYGLGVSYTGGVKYREKLLDLKNEIGSRLVIHTIAGITTPEDYKWLADNEFKVLILGYKRFGRGVMYQKSFSDSIKSKINWITENLDYLASHCESLSFDCLATEQLDLKNHVSKEEWEKYYMGDDGKFTMYVDLVSGTYGKNSTSCLTERYTIPSNQDISKMFKNILNK